MVLRLQNSLIHRGKGGKEKVCCHLPFDTAGVFSLLDVLVHFSDWQARGERFDGGCGAHIRVDLDPLGMLRALKGQRGRTGGRLSLLI